MIEFVNGYIQEYPQEKERILQIFKDTGEFAHIEGVSGKAIETLTNNTSKEQIEKVKRAFLKLLFRNF